WSALFKGLGMAPTPITSSEIYTGLQTHLLDACELPLVAYQVLRLYEAQQSGSLTSHAWGGYRMLANPDAWQRLPKKLRDIVERNINAGALRCREASARADVTLLSQIRSEGTLVNDCDIASFKAAVRTTGLYAQWRE